MLNSEHPSRQTMELSVPPLDRLEENYAAVLQLTSRAQALLANLESTAELRSVYAATRFVRVTDVLPGDALTELAARLGALLRPLATVVLFPHAPKHQSVLSFGGRFHKVDTGRPLGSKGQSKLDRLLGELGVTAFGGKLGVALTPLVRAIVGDVEYQRTYFYFYDEGDYIGAHDDSHVGERIDVQFPITFDGVGGIRVLSDGLFRMHYDRAGVMNILGPSMWHEVPPVVAVTDGKPPRRVNVGLRFEPTDRPKS